MDRMVSGFEPDAELLANPPRSLELWLDNQAQNDDDVILEWGAFQLTAAGLPKGRQCVSIVFDEANTVYINGRKIAKTVAVLAPADGQRLHLGGHYDDYRWNWKRIKRGQQIGTIGTNFGMYPAHLHFEIRHDITIGMQRNSSKATLTHWADPTKFINKYRRLNREWRGVAVPTGTYKEYRGFKGL